MTTVADHKLDRDDLRESAEEAIEYGYRYVEVVPSDLLALLNTPYDPDPHAPINIRTAHYALHDSPFGKCREDPRCVEAYTTLTAPRGVR